jgi:hypothetical protein
VVRVACLLFRARELEELRSSRASRGRELTECSRSLALAKDAAAPLRSTPPSSQAPTKSLRKNTTNLVSENADACTATPHAADDTSKNPTCRTGVSSLQRKEVEIRPNSLGGAAFATVGTL